MDYRPPVEEVGLDGEKTSDASSTQLHPQPQPQEGLLDGSSTQLQLHPQPQEGATEPSESTVAVKKSTSRSPKGLTPTLYTNLLLASPTPTWLAALSASRRFD